MIELVIEAAKLEQKDKGLESINPIWTRSSTLDREMAVHFNGEFPAFLFKQAAPNESKKAFDYRVSIYKPITKAPTGRALAATRRIWNPRNYTLPELPEYMTEDYPGYGSLLNYFVQTFHPKKFEWANAVQVVRPRMIPTKTVDNKVVVDASKELEPIAVIIPAVNVVDFNDLYCLVKSENKAVVVQPNGDKKRTGRIYEYYTDINITRYTETTPITAQEPVFTVEELFQDTHGLGYIPAIKMKGVPIKSVEGRLLYESYFAPALPNLESALIDNSTLQMSKYAHAFPQKWELVDACGNPRCTDGKVRGLDKDGEDTLEICEVCGGSGRSASPIETYQIRLRDADGELVPGIPTPPAGYITPNPEILEFARKEIDTAIEDAYMMLNLAVSNSDVKGEETALGKMIDRDELHSFLQAISNELFEAFTWTINTVGKMRELTWEDVEVKPPHDFQIRTQDDLLAEIADTSIPNIVRKDTLNEFIANRFASDEEVIRINEILMFVDKLYLLSPEDIRIQQQFMKPEDIVLHLYVMKYINEMTEAELNQELPVIEAQLLARAAEDVKKEEFNPIFEADEAP